MKIVRLTESNGQTAYFDNTFNDEIELPPFSEVALSSVSINTDPRLLEINVLSNTIPWKIAGAAREIDLASATYTESNYDRLLFDMYSNMNDDTNAGETITAGKSPETGLQWVISEDPKISGFGVESKMAIGYQVANLEGAPSTAFEYTNVVETGDGMDATYKRSGGSAGAADASIISKAPMGFGGARTYLNLQTIDNSAGGGFEGVIFGLTTTDHFAKKTKPVINEGIIEIYAQYTGQHFLVKSAAAGISADTGAVIAAGQMIGFERVGQEGYIDAVLYNAAGTRTQLNQSGTPSTSQHQQFYEDGGDSAGNLFPYIIIIGPATHVVVDQIQFSPDPYNIIKNNTYSIITKTSGTRGLQNGGILATETTGSIDFTLENSQKVARYLGFSAEQIKEISEPTSMKPDKFAWIAKEIFGSGLLGQGFYVELMTGTCDGFDGLTGQRKNILAVIPESDSDDKLLFQPSFPIFLEMNNSHPLVLRNIRARLLQTDGTNLGVTGMNSMTLLFKPGKSQ